MYDTKEKMKVHYEKVVVIGIYLPYAWEMLFEEDCHSLAVQYCRWMSSCLQLMKCEKGYRDCLVQNTHIYGIFKGDTWEDKAAIVHLSRVLYDRLRNIQYRKGDVTEEIFWGIGVSAGVAIPVSGNQIFKEISGNIWLGSVLEEARSLAEIAFCEGTDRIRIEKELWFTFL